MKRGPLLLTNDDGFDAPGLALLEEFLLAQRVRLTVVAPACEKSGTGHALTFGPLRVIRRRRASGAEGYAVGGTPADCVKWAMWRWKRRPFRAVVSGLNLGANVGVAILYSGTVAAALEAAFHGMRAAAFSLDSHHAEDLSRAREGLARAWPAVARGTWVPGEMINVNLPRRTPSRGIVVCSQALTVFREDYGRKGTAWFRLKKGQPGFFPGFRRAYSDWPLLKKGWITLTPLDWCLTRGDRLAYWKKQAASHG